MPHYLSAESIISARIEDQVPGLRAVLPVADLAGVTEAQQVTPAVYVIYDGDRIGQSAGRGVSQQIHQRWIAVVAVRNARDQRAGAAAREEAGPLIDALLAALDGWAPSLLHQPLVRISGPGPAFTPGGFGYFPFVFETRITTGGGT